MEWRSSVFLVSIYGGSEQVTSDFGAFRVRVVQWPFIGIDIAVAKYVLCCGGSATGASLFCRKQRV